MYELNIHRSILQKLYITAIKTSPVAGTSDENNMNPEDYEKLQQQTENTYRQ